MHQFVVNHVLYTKELTRIECPSECKKCIVNYSSRSCTQCSEGYILNDNSKCLSQNNSHCTIRNSTTTKCSQCEGNYYLLYGYCYQILDCSNNNALKLSDGTCIGLCNDIFLYSTN